MSSAVNSVFRDGGRSRNRTGNSRENGSNSRGDARPATPSPPTSNPQPNVVSIALEISRILVLVSNMSQSLEGMRNEIDELKRSMDSLIDTTSKQRGSPTKNCYCTWQRFLNGIFSRIFVNCKYYDKKTVIRNISFELAHVAGLVIRSGAMSAAERDQIVRFSMQTEAELLTNSQLNRFMSNFWNRERKNFNKKILETFAVCFPEQAETPVFKWLRSHSLTAKDRPRVPILPTQNDTIDWESLMEEIGAGQVEVEDVPLLSLTDRAAYSIVDNIHQAWVEKGENPSHSDLVYLKLYVALLVEGKVAQQNWGDLRSEYVDSMQSQQQPNAPENEVYEAAFREYEAILRTNASTFRDDEDDDILPAKRRRTGNDNADDDTEEIVDD